MVLPVLVLALVDMDSPLEEVAPAPPDAVLVTLATLMEPAPPEPTGEPVVAAPEPLVTVLSVEPLVLALDVVGVPVPVPP